MTTQADIVGGATNVLYGRQKICLLGGDQTEDVSLLNHGAVVVGRVTDQAVHVGLVLLVQLLRQIRLSSQPDVAQNATNWLRREPGIRRLD